MKSRYNKRKYLRYLRSADWILKKTEFIIWKLERKEKIRCKKCRTKYNINFHHKTYENLYDEKMEDLEILCKKFHKAIHQKLKQARKQK